MRNAEEISAIVVDTAFRIHKALGPGLLESAYELVLAEKLVREGLTVDRQMPIDIEFENIRVDHAFRIDLLVDGKLIVEIKSVETFNPAHAKQVLTYLKLTNLSLGLLINFGAVSFREGIRRLVNNHTDFASSRLRANQT